MSIWVVVDLVYELSDGADQDRVAFPLSDSYEFARSSDVHGAVLEYLRTPYFELTDADGGTWEFYTATIRTIAVISVGRGLPS